MAEAVVLGFKCCAVDMVDEVTFFKFFTEVKNYLKDILRDPLNAKPSKFFTQHGISKSELQNRLLERGVIVRKEDIKEIEDDNGNLKSLHYVRYSIPRSDFEHKMHRLYSHFFENGKKKENIGENMKSVIRITESDIHNIVYNAASKIIKNLMEDGGFVGGDGSAASNASGTLNGATNAQMSSNAQYDAPAFGGLVMKRKDPTMYRKNGKGGSISIPKRRK